jgi:CheY-like chemotaxis protein
MPHIVVSWGYGFALGMVRDFHGSLTALTYLNAEAGIALASSVPVVGGLPGHRGDDAEAGHRVAVMAKPVLVVVDAEDTSLQALTRELESRYGAHYQVVAGSSAEVALDRLAELRAAGADVPLVLADLQLPGMSGTELLARVREIFPTARRGLLISWGDRAAAAPFLEAAALGRLEFYLPKPACPTGGWEFPNWRHWPALASSTAPAPSKRRPWQGNRPSWWAAATQPGKPRCTCRSTRGRSRFWSAPGPWRRACRTT